MPKIEDLGPLELAVMRAVWRLSTATVREVLEALEAEGRKPAYTTVQTVMTRLEEKEFLRHKVAGKTFHYRARVSESRVQRKLLSGLLEDVFGGAVGPLVTQLAETKKLRRKDIQALRDVVDSLEDETENE